MEITIPLGSDCCVAYQMKEHGIRIASYPFDWCRSSIQQLIQCIIDDFKIFQTLDIGTRSNLHPEIDEDGNLLSGGSFIVKNGYEMLLAHELTSTDKLEHYRSRINDRITRFRMALNDTSRCIHFIRKESAKIKKSYIEHLVKLIELLPSHCKLSLVVHSSSREFLKHLEDQYIGKLRIIYYQDFSKDWRCCHLDWDTIFAWPESPEQPAP